MITAEYGFVHPFNHGFLQERPGKLAWQYDQSNYVSSKVALEEEIRVLRKAMEQAYRDHQSFTADVVIEISRALDIKINEYMRMKSKC
jgi:plasmid maintenance system antidote protein VapI